MRANLASAIGVACTAALVIPLSLPAAAQAATSDAPDGARHTAVTAPADPSAATAPAADPADRAAVPGSTQSLPLVGLRADQTTGAPQQGLSQREVQPFSLLGVVWEDPATALDGAVQVRTRAASTGTWSEWQDLETHNEAHGADASTAEGAAGGLRGSTAPLWVGPSDGVEVRVRAEAPRAGSSAAPLPRGLRVDLVDPGADPAPTATPPTDTTPGSGADTAADSPVTSGALTAEESAASAVNAEHAPLGALEIPELSKADTDALYAEEAAELSEQAGEVPAAKPYVGPRPGIVTRKGWGADESMREKNFVYTKSVQAAFVHHSATGNNYTCQQAPSVLRGIYRYHVKSSGWRDFGYNFAVDKCGKIYEGRAGGVAKAVLGAHTLGFNSNSMGVVVLGTYGSSTPPAAAVDGVAKITAWKLGLYGKNPSGSVTLTSGGSNLYKKGVKVKLNVISGHRDGFSTECPGARLYDRLGTARSTAARLQGR
ncbi:N-acetylmuramoyl-L-alanine amidase [Streptomyces solincola]|uniref:N-acetylmuramoyl-L-alanine amidase n=1 Tax=Streptomyces solincola TaxID=2100817 RepID=A0A2S9PNF6_9ACTN|nr:peptidoglycan recognition protein [Streptomyces solincola]PRH75935.1 N-acetylmuramoyl-L-alanine amidase [Streptomyces solincola]